MALAELALSGSALVDSTTTGPELAPSFKRPFKRLSFKRLLLIAAGGFAGVFSLSSHGEATLPYAAQATHLGVASCSGSTCHGANVEFQDSTVWQNEFTVWGEEDAHSQAYAVLLNEQSERIARNLGLKAAHTADECLDCHSDNVPAERRGEKFSLEDGVGCEACHGGGESYRDSHYEQGAKREDSLAQGLYPTEDPVARAELCLSCHLGNKDKFVTHRIMGAGHPRLSFELDTFTADQPAHFDVDADYQERKKVWDGVQVWAVGQTIAARYFLDAVADSGNTGLFPELALFDCHACHRSMDGKQWQPRASTGLGPGVLRFNDAHLLMTYQLARVAAPTLAKKVRTAIRELHQSSRKNQAAYRSASQKTAKLLDEVQTRLAEHQFTEADMYNIVDALIQNGMRGEYRDYAAAEQTVMAVGSILYTLDRTEAFTEARGDELFKALDQLYKALDDDDRFDPQRFARDLKTFRAVVKG